MVTARKVGLYASGAIALLFLWGPIALLVPVAIEQYQNLPQLLSLSPLTDQSYFNTATLAVESLETDDFMDDRNRRLYSRRHPRRTWNNSHTGNIFVLPLQNTVQEVPAGPWRDVAMPSKSFFADFDPPTNVLRWNQALLQAARGEQVLLERVLRVIRSPTDLFENDKNFKWLHHAADFRKSATKEDNWLTELQFVKGQRAPVVMLGYRKFEHPLFEGPLTGIPSLGPGEIMKLGRGKFNVPRKIVAVGNADENWGWLSTYFLNRTVPWAMSFDSVDSPFSKDFRYPQQQVQEVLDNDNIVALIISQHHNISHPKVCP